ncbi:MAG: M23 family metallopeptidase, partial [Bacillota bacterium]
MNGPFYGSFRVTQIYKGSTHKGLDLAGVNSKEIHSTVNGVVEVAGWDMKSGSTAVDTTYGLGQYVRIKGEATNYVYYFGHMSKILVSAGQKVKKGDVIGIEGSTGHATGPHVHYEIRRVTDNSTFLNVSEISGIPNLLGTYTQNPPNANLEAAKKIVQEKAGLADMTMNYMEEY